MEKVTFKYEIGQMVTLTHCPSFNNMQHGKYVKESDFKPKEYKVASCFYKVDEDGNTSILYQLYAYMDDCIQYHNRIPEEHLDGELHEHTEEIDFCDVNGEPLSIGDYAYSGIYYGRVKDSYVNPGFTFTRKMAIVGFEYSNKGTFFIDGTVKKVALTSAICKEVYPNEDSRWEHSEIAGLMIKTIGEKFVEDYVKGCRSHRFNPTVDKYGDKHEEWLKKLGVYDEVCKLYKKRPSAKKKTEKKKTESEVSKDVKAILAGMSEEEKAEMLKQLMKNK